MSDCFSRTFNVRLVKIVVLNPRDTVYPPIQNYITNYSRYMYKVKSHDKVITTQIFLWQILFYIDHAFATKQYGNFNENENKYRVFT